MDLRWRDGDSEVRFSAYMEHLSDCLGHADRVGPFRSYCTGLLLPGERKSVEPMAARLRPDRTSAEHQSLLHFVGQSCRRKIVLNELWDQRAPGDEVDQCNMGNFHETTQDTIGNP